MVLRVVLSALLLFLSFLPVFAARGFVTVRFPVGGVLVTVLVALVVFLVGFGAFVLLVPSRKRDSTGRVRSFLRDKTASAVQ